VPEALGGERGGGGFFFSSPLLPSRGGKERSWILVPLLFLGGNGDCAQLIVILNPGYLRSGNVWMSKEREREREREREKMLLTINR
jgi:hypothetical protein